MEVLRYLIVLIELCGLCLLFWRLAAGRWRWFAIALMVNSLVIAFMLADAQTLDSWGVVPGAAWAFLILGLLAAIFVLPAIVFWPQTPRQALRATFSIFLVTLWLGGIHTFGLVGAVWERWKVCLPPGYVVEYAPGPEIPPPDCEIGPL